MRTGFMAAPQTPESGHGMARLTTSDPTLRGIDLGASMLKHWMSYGLVLVAGMAMVVGCEGDGGTLPAALVGDTVKTNFVGAAGWVGPSSLPQATMTRGAETAIAVRKPVRIPSSVRIRHGIGARPIKRDSSEQSPRDHRIGDLRFGEASERRRQSEGEPGMAQGHRPDTVNIRAGTVRRQSLASPTSLKHNGQRWLHHATNPL